MDQQSSHVTPQTSPTGGGPDFNFIISRAKLIITNPKEAWAQISQERPSIKELAVNYLLVIAAIGPICSAIGNMVVGRTNPLTLVTERTSPGVALFGAVFQYIVFVAAIFIGAMLVEFLAPKFAGQASRNEGFKLLAYAATPGCIAGIFGLVPWAIFGLLGLLLGLYGLYVLYLGITPVTGVPESKRALFCGALVILMFVITLILSLIVGALGFVGAVI